MNDFPDRSLYYDMQGRPVDMMTWAAMFENPEARRVGRFDGQWVQVSTVHLGLDHGFGGERPIIFETMVFAKRLPFLSRTGDVDMDRYCTLAEAKGGHLAMVERWKGLRGLLRLCWLSLVACADRFRKV